MLFVAPCVGDGWLANVEMVLPNLSWKQNGYGNIAVTVAFTISGIGDGGVCDLRSSCDGVVVYGYG